MTGFGWWACVDFNHGPLPYQGSRGHLRSPPIRSLSWRYCPRASVLVFLPPSRLLRSKSLRPVEHTAPEAVPS